MREAASVYVAPMSVDVVIEDARWDAAGLEDLSERAVSGVLAELGLAAADWSVVVMGCDDARISELNAGFRRKDAATNVLSWPSEERGATVEGAVPDPPDGDLELGDIAIAYDTCAREAAAGNKSLSDHAMHLIVHGTLHLLGYDHIRDGDGDLMEAVEIAILGKLGVANPYKG